MQVQSFAKVAKIRLLDKCLQSSEFSFPTSWLSQQATKGPCFSPLKLLMII